MHAEDTWTTTPLTADLVRGASASALERTAHGLLPHRLPAAARAQCDDGQLHMAESQPSGVRLAFRTAATAVELDTLPTKRAYTGLPALPDGLYDLVVDGSLADQGTVPGGNTLTVDMRAGTAETTSGRGGTLRFTGLPDRMKDVEIWLPHNETTELLALRTDAAVEPLPDRGRRVWLHHGSSISQGSNARRAPARPGPRSPPRAAAWSWSTWGWAAGHCSTRAPPGRCGTPRPT